MQINWKKIIVTISAAMLQASEAALVGKSSSGSDQVLNLSRSNKNASTPTITEDDVIDDDHTGEDTCDLDDDDIDDEPEDLIISQQSKH